MNDKNQAKEKFDFNEIVEVIAFEFQGKKLDGYKGAVLGKACSEKGHWTYSVLLFDLEFCFTFGEEKLKSTGKFMPEGFNKTGETIRVVVNKKGEGRIKDE